MHKICAKSGLCDKHLDKQLLVRDGQQNFLCPPYSPEITSYDIWSRTSGQLLWRGKRLWQWSWTLSLQRTSMEPSWIGWGATGALKSNGPILKKIRVMSFYEINKYLSWKNIWKHLEYTWKGVGVLVSLCLDIMWWL